MVSVLMQAAVVQMCILPMYEQMEHRNPGRFAKCLGISFGFVAFLFVGFSSIAYVAIGPHVSSNVLIDLPHGTFGGFARVVMAFAVIGVYPILTSSMVAPIQHQSGPWRPHPYGILTHCSGNKPATLQHAWQPWQKKVGHRCYRGLKWRFDLGWDVQPPNFCCVHSKPSKKSQVIACVTTDLGEATHRASVVSELRQPLRQPTPMTTSGIPSSSLAFCLQLQCILQSFHSTRCRHGACMYVRTQRTADSRSSRNSFNSFESIAGQCDQRGLPGRGVGSPAHGDLNTRAAPKNS